MIKAIQTQYKGYHFRSRLEARWAVFFDAMKMAWVYEPEGFELPDGSRYLPDFFLPNFCGQQGTYVEIKPYVGGDFTKARMFAKHVSRVILLAGDPGCVAFEFADNDAVNNDVFNNGTWFWSGKYSPGGANYPQEYGPFCTNVNVGEPMEEYIYPSVLAAIFRARSARFEHGQSGATL